MVTHNKIQPTLLNNTSPNSSNLKHKTTKQQNNPYQTTQSQPINQTKQQVKTKLKTLINQPLT